MGDKEETLLKGSLSEMRNRSFGLGRIVILELALAIASGVSRVQGASTAQESTVSSASAPGKPGPPVPCQKDAKLSFGEIDESPLIKVWSEAELGKDWAPPGCTGWNTTGFSSLITIAGRFRNGNDASAMMQHVGAISSLAGVKYWSTTHKKWRVLIAEASALQDADLNGRRGDFALDEMKEGKTLYFEQVDNLSGKGLYRMQIMKASGGQIIFEVENFSAIRRMLIPIFHPGDAQAVYFLERESEGVWRYYSIVRTGNKANGLVARNEASLINRAVALYRHLAGIPTDQEPAAAP